MRGDTARLAGSAAPVHPQDEPPSQRQEESAGAFSDNNGTEESRQQPRPHARPTVRSGSNKRRRSACLAVRLTPAEREAIEAAAERAGLATGSYARQILLGAPAPRQVRRPPIERRELARLLGELGHVGSNLNQLAHASNSGFPVGRSAIDKMLDGLEEVRRAILEALGRPA